MQSIIDSNIMGTVSITQPQSPIIQEDFWPFSLSFLLLLGAHIFGGDGVSLPCSNESVQGVGQGAFPQHVPSYVQLGLRVEPGAAQSLSLVPHLITFLTGHPWPV